MSIPGDAPQNLLRPEAAEVTDELFANGWRGGSLDKAVPQINLPSHRCIHFLTSSIFVECSHTFSCIFLMLCFFAFCYCDRLCGTCGTTLGTTSTANGHLPEHHSGLTS